MNHVQAGGLLFLTAILLSVTSSLSPTPVAPVSPGKDSLINYLRERNLQMLYHIEEKTRTYEKIHPDSTWKY